MNCILHIKDLLPDSCCVSGMCHYKLCCTTVYHCLALCIIVYLFNAWLMFVATTTTGGGVKFLKLV